MKTISLATGNQRKLGEARAACKDFDIEVEQVRLAIDEIQSHDPLAITRHKIDRAYDLAGRPILVTDTSWSIPALKGFPGGYMKDVSEWFEPEDFIRLLGGKDKTVCFRETIAYKDASQTKLFTKEYRGVIADAPKGQGESIEQVAEFDGYTLAERHDQGRFSHDPKDYIWYEFAEWFSRQAP